MNNEEIVNRNLQLMNLHEGIMSVDSRLKVSNLFHNANVGLDKQTLTKMMIQYKLISAFPNYDMWIVQNFLQLNRFHNNDPNR